MLKIFVYFVTFLKKDKYVLCFVAMMLVLGLTPACFSKGGFSSLGLLFK